MTKTHLHLLDDYLRTQPNVQMLTSILLPGASAELIAKQEEELGWEIHEEIKSFFMAHNGVLLRWIDRDADRFAPKLHIENSEFDSDDLWTAMDQYNDYDPLMPEGKIFIPAFETIFTLTDYVDDVSPRDDPFLFNIWMEETFADMAGWNFLQGEHTFKGQLYKSYKGLLKEMRMLDFYTRDDAVFLHLEKGNPDPPAVYGEAFSLNEKETMPLSLYLKLLPYCLGKSINKWPMFSDPVRWFASNADLEMPFPLPF